MFPAVEIFHFGRREPNIFALRAQTLAQTIITSSGWCKAKARSSTALDHAEDHAACSYTQRHARIAATGKDGFLKRRRIPINAILGNLCSYHTSLLHLVLSVIQVHRLFDVRSFKFLLLRNVTSMAPSNTNISSSKRKGESDSKRCPTRWINAVCGRGSENSC